MSELGNAMRMLSQRFPTCVQGPINYPIHQGKPNPAHGKFFFVGAIPAACATEDGRSLKYDTEDAAIRAAIAAGAERIQDARCRFVDIENYGGCA
jgi:hypothetical protein